MLSFHIRSQQITLRSAAKSLLLTSDTPPPLLHLGKSRMTAAQSPWQNTSTQIRQQRILTPSALAWLVGETHGRKHSRQQQGSQQKGSAPHPSTRQVCLGLQPQQAIMSLQRPLPPMALLQVLLLRVCQQSKPSRWERQHQELQQTQTPRQPQLHQVQLQPDRHLSQARSSTSLRALQIHRANHQRHQLTIPDPSSGQEGSPQVCDS